MDRSTEWRRISVGLTFWTIAAALGLAAVVAPRRRRSRF
jgi:hypothetical protein